jgi:hypothetical protein
MKKQKKLTNRSQREWEATLEVAKGATESQIHEAKAIYRELDTKYPVKRSEAFGFALHRIFSTKGETIGSVVMIEFVQAMGGNIGR